MNPRKPNRRNQVEDEEFMKISDYSEGKESLNNHSQVEEYPIEQFQDYIDKKQNNFSKPESLYINHIKELRKDIQKYVSFCQELSQNVRDLEDELRQFESKQIDIEQVFGVLGWLEQELFTYKEEFQNYRIKQTAIGIQKDQEIQYLRNTVQTIKRQRDSMVMERDDFDSKNSDLETQNQNLLTEIDALQGELSDLKNMKSSPHMKMSKRTVFDDEIQVELQSLIQKLMSELEGERNNCRKAMQQMKGMQQQILELQRDVVSKSNKIYALEMNNVKSKRESPKNQSKLYMFQRNKSSRQFHTSQDQIDNVKSKSDRQSILKNIRLDNIISDDLEVSERERYTIASKLAHFYIKKFETSDFQPYNIDQLLICNFNKTNPSLIMIKKDPDACSYRQKTSPKVLSWNLGILLSKLLIEPTYQSEFTDQSIELVHKSIDRFVHDEKPTAKTVRQLKHFLDDVLKSIE